jgi:hypothetical protein
LFELLVSQLTALNNYTKYLLFWAGVLLSQGAMAQRTMTAQDYINAYKDAAVQNMQLKRIPASITLSQGMLESGNGNSVLARRSNNHFGIKCGPNWKGKSVRHDDDAKNECFRKYDTVLESYMDHADFLANGQRYRSLFDLDITDYKGWARGLSRAGYATDPQYANKLIGIIERNRLNDLDRGVPNFTPRAQAIFTNNRRPVIKIQEGESKMGIANNLDIKLKKLERYNEMGPADDVLPGQLLYLAPKRNRAARKLMTHTVREGETMYDISQQYGMRMGALMRKNGMWYAARIKPGDQLMLRRKGILSFL